MSNSVDFLKWYHKAEYIKSEEFTDYMDSAEISVKETVEFYNYKFESFIDYQEVFLALFIQRCANEYLESCRSRSGIFFSAMGDFKIKITDARATISGEDIYLKCSKTNHGTASGLWYDSCLKIKKWVFEYLRDGKFKYLSAKYIDFEEPA